MGTECNYIYSTAYVIQVFHPTAKDRPINNGT